MGIVASLTRRQVSRPLKNYNVEERAMKVISQDKPTAAPPHPKMKQIMEDIRRDPSKLKRKTEKTDPKLLSNLSQVYITSSGDNPDVAEKRLPINRTPPDEPKFGYEVPVTITPGKASLPLLLEMIAHHANEPDTYPPGTLARMYKLDIVDVVNILEYYKTLQLFTPPKVIPDKELSPLRRLQSGIDNLKK